VVLIVTSKDEYKNKFAIKVQSAIYDEKVKKNLDIRHIKELNYIVNKEVLALCRLKELNEAAITDQFPLIEEYFVCPASSVPEPYNSYLVKDIEHDDNNNKLEQHVEASIIVMSYIEGKVLEHYLMDSTPKTVAFDMYYGIFAAVFYAKLDFMEDFHLENAIVTTNPIDTYFIITYRDNTQQNEETTDATTDVIIRIPKGYPRLKFIDFGEAINIGSKSITKNTSLSQFHKALYPLRVFKSYTIVNKHFPLLDTYVKKLNHTHQTVYHFWNDIISLIVNMMNEFIYIGDIPNYTLTYSLRFPE
jgi:hypothetical protein